MITYVQWNGSAWVEIAEPDTNYKLDATTLPHGLIQTGANDWVIWSTCNGKIDRLVMIKLTHFLALLVYLFSVSSLI